MTKDEVIRLSDLPRSGRDRLPWEEWEKLQPGEAKDVTEIVGSSYASGRGATAAPYGLRFTTRQGRLYIYRPESETGR